MMIVFRVLPCSQETFTDVSEVPAAVVSGLRERVVFSSTPSVHLNGVALGHRQKIEPEQSVRPSVCYVLFV
jgi:hypothetical protein